jgi:predicted amidohydrolase
MIPDFKETTLPPQIRVGVIQLQVTTNRTDENLSRAQKLLRSASDAGCQLAVLPEAFATGLNLPKSRQHASSIPGRALDWLAEQASRAHLYLAAGLLEASGDSVYSSVVLLDDRGSLLHVYRRNNIYDLESYFLCAGQQCFALDTGLGRIGLVAGYDVQFPETLRLLFAQGVEIVICPALLLRPFRESIRQMAIARAAENCCYFLFSSATGENTLAGLTYLGNSMILQSPVGIAPYSQDFRKQDAVLAEADREERLLVSTLNMSGLRRLQAANPLFRDFQRSDFFNLVAAHPGTWKDRV